MEFYELQNMCRRAATHTCSKQKLVLSSLVLAISGLLVVLAMGLSLHAGSWVSLCLAFMPLFIISCVLTTLGCVLIQGYRDEIKNQSTGYTELITISWQHMVRASYFYLPLVLCYLCFWIVLGIFFLLREIPTIGEFFGVILAFGPFLLLFASLLLSVLAIFLAFVVSPVIALKKVQGTELLQYMQEKLQSNVFARVCLFCLSVVPLCATGILLFIAAHLTTLMYEVSQNHLQMILQWFFIMIPFASILAPAVVFFFNMAAETHIYVQKKIISLR
jgi:uncharacterized membrane protein